MKQTILIFFIITFITIHGQRYDKYSQKNSFSISVGTILFFENPYIKEEASLFLLHFEIQQKINNKIQHNFRLGISRVYTKTIVSPKVMPRAEYTLGLKLRKLLFEIGTGIDLIPYIYIYPKFGYQYMLYNRYLIQIAYTPSLWLGWTHINGFHGLTLGIGYHFNRKKSDAISSSFAFIGKRISIQAMSYPISFDEPGSIIPSLVFDLDFLILKKDNHRFSIHGGSGLLLEGSVFSQIGINYLYGREAHFLEFSTNLCFTELSNPNLDWDESSYRLLQPQLGYHYQCQKLPFFARIAYAPYIRTLDWKREGGLHHNMVMGVGYRFHK